MKRDAHLDRSSSVTWTEKTRRWKSETPGRDFTAGTIASEGTPLFNSGARQRGNHSSQPLYTSHNSLITNCYLGDLKCTMNTQKWFLLSSITAVTYSNKDDGWSWPLFDSHANCDKLIWRKFIQSFQGKYNYTRPSPVDKLGLCLWINVSVFATTICQVEEKEFIRLKKKNSPG